MRRRFGFSGITGAAAVVTALTVPALPRMAAAQMRITEYMYQGAEVPPGVSAEFVEFTNVGGSPINMAGWKFDDSDGPPVDISAFGVVAAHQSVILCEATAAQFIAAWGLSGVVVIGGNANNLGRNDSIKLLDNTNALIDHLDYGDQTFPGSIRTNGASGWPCAQGLGANDIDLWRLSFVGDGQGSHSSTAFNVANPGSFVDPPIICPLDPMGGCCEWNEQSDTVDCNIRTQADCTGLGLYRGDNTDCTAACVQPTHALIRITEYMYGPTPREFIEFKNIGGVSVNMAGWSYSDESRVPGLVSLSAFGMVAPGATFVLTESEPGDFQADWNLSPAFNVIPSNSVNLGPADEINLYDNSGARVDRLTYGHLDCSINAEGTSGWPCPDALGDNDILEWRESAVGDAQSSVLSDDHDLGGGVDKDTGNPGMYNQAAPCLAGSCCVSGVCSVLTQGDCLMQEGLYFGDGTNCTTEPCPPANPAKVWITEFMYQGAGGATGEFFEVTNLGDSAVNLSGWSFEDTCTLAGAFDISGLGILAPEQSGIVTDISAAAFRTRWNLPMTVPVVSLPSSELGRDDKIIMHDANGAVVDRLDYGDQSFPGTILTQGTSGWPNLQSVGENNITGWRLSVVGDNQLSYASTAGEVGNPGTFEAPAVATWGMVNMLLLVFTVGTIVSRRAVLLRSV